MRPLPVPTAPTAPTALAWALALALGLGSFACTNEPAHDAPATTAAAKPGLAPGPSAAEPRPPTTGETGAAVEPQPEPEPELRPDPRPSFETLDERKLALANVGRDAFDAIKGGDITALLKLTPRDPGPLHDACPDMPISPEPELEARFDHCHEAIAWGSVAEAQVFAGHPSGTPASGCSADIEDYGRLQLFLHMTDATIWRVDFFGAVGQDGNAVGINGEVSCQTVDEAPPLK